MATPAKPTILVVDDSEAGRYATARILRREGFEVLEAASGAEALRLAAERPALVVLDVNARLHTEVKAARDVLQSIVQNSADAIVATDLEGRVTHFSPGAEDAFGVPAARAIGRSVADRFEGGRDEVRALERRLHAGERIRGYETRIRTRDRGWVDASLSMSLMRDTDRRFPPAVETAAFRIVQEALTNVARHAGVREAAVRLWTGDDVLYCQVVDHGVGFSPATSQEEESTGGLSGMRERARLLGGDVRVESVPAAGVVLTAELPPSRPDAARPEDPA